MLLWFLFARLTHWGRVMHICVSKLTIIGSDNGLSPGRRQAIIWTNAGVLQIGPWETNFSEILIKIYTFLFKKMHLKLSSGKRQPLCLGLNVLTMVVFCSISVISASSLKCRLKNIFYHRSLTMKNWVTVLWQNQWTEDLVHHFGADLKSHLLIKKQQWEINIDPALRFDRLTLMGSISIRSR